MNKNTQAQFNTYKNYYHVLGVIPDATQHTISKEFKKLALKWHPDRHSEFQQAFAHRRFLEIIEAYEVIGHPGKRRKYDAYRTHRRQRPRSTPSYSNTTSQSLKKQRVKREAKDRYSKYEKNMKSWKKSSKKRARNLAKEQFLSFAGTLEKVSHSIFSGLSHAVDIISGNLAYKKKIRTYEKKLKKSPKDVETNYNLAFTYHTNGVYEEAVKYYLQAIKLAPKNADLFCNLGRLREEQNEYERAISCYQRAVHLEPEALPVYTYLGILHLKMKNFIEAKKCMDKLHAMNRPDLAKQIERVYTP